MHTHEEEKVLNGRPWSFIKYDPAKGADDPEYKPPAKGPEGDPDPEPLQPVDDDPSPGPEPGEGSGPPSPVTPN